MTLAQIEAVAGLDRRAAREVAVVTRLERRRGGLVRGSEAWTYALRSTGQRLLDEAGRARRPHLPGPAMWAHALLGAGVYTRLVEATRGTDQTLAEWQGNPSCWRDYPGPYGESLRLKPDAFVVTSGAECEDVCFKEIDARCQSRTVVRAKLDAYRRYAASGQEQGAQDGVFPLTVFITTTIHREAILLDLIVELTTETARLFAVGQVADPARLLTGGAA